MTKHYASGIVCPGVMWKSRGPGVQIVHFWGSHKWACPPINISRSMLSTQKEKKKESQSRRMTPLDPTSLDGRKDDVPRSGSLTSPYHSPFCSWLRPSLEGSRRLCSTWFANWARMEASVHLYRLLFRLQQANISLLPPLPLPLLPSAIIRLPLRYHCPFHQRLPFLHRK